MCYVCHEWHSLIGCMNIWVAIARSNPSISELVGGYILCIPEDALSEHVVCPRVRPGSLYCLQGCQWPHLTGSGACFSPSWQRARDWAKPITEKSAGYSDISETIAVFWHLFCYSGFGLLVKKPSLPIYPLFQMVLVPAWVTRPVFQFWGGRGDYWGEDPRAGRNSQPQPNTRPKIWPKFRQSTYSYHPHLSRLRNWKSDQDSVTSSV